jgi:hypothetical protein
MYDFHMPDSSAKLKTMHFRFGLRTIRMLKMLAARKEVSMTRCAFAKEFDAE